MKLPVQGQRYRNVEMRFREADWVLAKVFTGADGIEYASLEALGNRTQRKTLALAIVMDLRRFVPLETPATTA